MRFLGAGLLLLLCSGQAAAGTGLPSLWGQQYGKVQSKNFGSLGTFWAQAMIGAPEGHRYLARLEGEGFKFYQTSIGIFEESVSLDPAFLQARVAPELLAVLAAEVAEYDALLQKNADDWHTEDYAAIVAARQRRQLGTAGGHVTAVANLLNGKSPVGISRNGVLAAEIERAYEEDEDDVTRMALVSNTARLVDIINMSTYFVRFEATQALSDYAAESGGGVLCVICAGNDFPTPLYGNGKHGEGRLNLITVGSCAPTGYFSYFSRAGEHLTISAPGDDDISSIAAGTGKLTAFSGTSATAPLVSGALADVISIIPDLSLDEAIHMLQATAIPTSINAQQEGHGVLNYYKLLRVAVRVQQTAAGDKHKLRALLFDDTMYDFSAEARQLQDIARTEPARGFFSLREAFFLDSQAVEIRSQLAEMYRHAGYEAEAIFYDDPAASQRQPQVQTFVTYRRLLTDMAETPIYDGNGWTEKFRDYLAIAWRNPQNPRLLDVLLQRLLRDDLHEAQLSGNLVQDLRLDPAALAIEKPHLFALLKRHQDRLNE